MDELAEQVSSKVEMNAFKSALEQKCSFGEVDFLKRQMEQLSSSLKEKSSFRDLEQATKFFQQHCEEL